MPDIRELLFTPLLPNAPEPKTYTPGIDYERGTVETPETIALKTLRDQLTKRSYENLIQPMSAPIGLAMTALTAAAPGAAAPLNKLLAAVMIPQMVVGGAKDIKKGDYAQGITNLAFALPVLAGGGIKVKGFNEGPIGSTVTKPAATYKAGAAAAAADQNVWVRQSNSASNADRTLMVQYSSPVIQTGVRAAGKEFYDQLYSGSRSGYVRPGTDFFELPQWQAKVAQNLPNADVYIVRNPAELDAFVKKAGYKNVAFSSLDINSGLIQELAKSNPQQHIVVGGYADHSQFKGIKNVTIHPTIESFVESEGRKPIEGFDYRHYQGTETIPRLTMSSGCTHNCAFCSITKKLDLSSKEEIMQQAKNIGQNLDAKLVYLNDKTFGQAPNYKMLPEVYAEIKKYNPNFEGFVVQTTATQVARGNLTPEFLREAHIKNVELGIETYNDPILKTMRKPATEKIMDEAAANIRKAGSNLIPNLIVGLPGETPATYAHTMSFLERNRDIISHPNVEFLELYTDSELANQMKAKVGQMGVDTASPATHAAAKAYYDFGQSQLAAPSHTERIAAAGPTAGPQLGQLLAPPPGPQKTIKAFKLFDMDEQGNLHPMIVGTKQTIPVGQWIEAEIGPAGKAEGKVKSKLGDLAMRPGFHSSELPVATHIGGKSEPGLKTPDYRPANQVWAEVELPADVDWQTAADSRAQISKKGTPIASTAAITDQIPVGGHYRFKTNPNAEVPWFISGGMKVNRILSDAEVADINRAAGVADLPRLPGQERTAAMGELLAPPKPVEPQTAPIKMQAEPQAPAPVPYKSRLDLAKLGKIVEPQDLEYGFILPDGRAVSIKGIGGGSHGPRLLEAMGEKPTADWNQEASQWRQLANDEGVVRVNSSSMGTGVELYSHPTDAQLRTMREMEKARGVDLTWDLTDPYTARPGGLNVIGTGTGVRYIRGGIEAKKYNPQRPKEPPKISELLTPPGLGMPSLGELLQGGYSA